MDTSVRLDHYHLVPSDEHLIAGIGNQTDFCNKRNAYWDARKKTKSFGKILSRSLCCGFIFVIGSAVAYSDTQRAGALGALITSVSAVGLAILVYCIRCGTEEKNKNRLITWAKTYREDQEGKKFLDQLRQEELEAKQEEEDEKRWRENMPIVPPS